MNLPRMGQRCPSINQDTTQTSAEVAMLRTLQKTSRLTRSNLIALPVPIGEVMKKIQCSPVSTAWRSIPKKNLMHISQFEKKLDQEIIKSLGLNTNCLCSMRPHLACRIGYPKGWFSITS